MCVCVCLLLDDEVLSKRIPPSFFLSCNLDGGREGPRVRDRKNGKEKVNIDEEIRKAEEIKGVLPPPDNPPSIFVIFTMCKNVLHVATLSLS